MKAASAAMISGEKNDIFYIAFLNDEPEFVEDAGTFTLTKHPPHPGKVVRAAYLELLSLTVAVAAVMALPGNSMAHSISSAAGVEAAEA